MKLIELVTIVFLLYLFSMVIIYDARNIEPFLFLSTLILSMPLFYLIYIFSVALYFLLLFDVYPSNCLVYTLCGFFWTSSTVFTMFSNNFSSTCVSTQWSKYSEYKLKQRKCKQLTNVSREDKKYSFPHLV